MKNTLSILTLLLFISQAYSIAGFGLNLNKTMFTLDAKPNSLSYGYGYDAISGGNGCVAGGCDPLPLLSTGNSERQNGSVDGAKQRKQHCDKAKICNHEMQLQWVIDGKPDGHRTRKSTGLVGCLVG